MLLSSSHHLRLPTTAIFRRTRPAVSCRILSFANKLTAPRGNGAVGLSHLDSNSMHLTQSPSLSIDANMRCRQDPELGLAAVLFVISMVLGSFFSLLVVSLPALHAFEKLAASTAKLSKVVSEEVPGTLSSLKLSGLEINDLTCQLNSLKRIISGDRYVERKKKQSKIAKFSREK
ncbi:hypothetical protein KSP39_PZI023903 [Platanthera zijinensis]|uniref:Uncharacterized protein n=1 Tax=Platanthera zijinensis TaxID=2320716 RepID=A0AAP0ATY0_9ASPA